MAEEPFVVRGDVPVLDEQTVHNAYYQSGLLSFDVCKACGRQARTTASLMKCSRCLETSYCCKDCQRTDWSNHKSGCRTSGTYSRRLNLFQNLYRPLLYRACTASFLGSKLERGQDFSNLLVMVFDFSPEFKIQGTSLQFIQAGLPASARRHFALPTPGNLRPAYLLRRGSLYTIPECYNLDAEELVGEDTPIATLEDLKHEVHQSVQTMMEMDCGLQINLQLQAHKGAYRRRIEEDPAFKRDIDDGTVQTIPYFFAPEMQFSLNAFATPV